MREFQRGLEPYSEKETANLSNSERVILAKSDADVCEFVNGSLSGAIKGKKLLLGRIGGGLARRIKSETAVDLQGYNLELRSDEIKHTFNAHGSPAKEAPRGQQVITTEDILAFPHVVSEYDTVAVAYDNSLHFAKDVNGRITAVTLYAGKSKSLSLKTMHKSIKRGGAFPASNAPESPAHNVRNDWGATASDIHNIQQ